MIVLAAPVSTSTFAISIDTPEYVSVAVTKASSCRNVSCTQPPDPQPQPLLELELGLARVHEAELAIRMHAAKLGVSLHRRATIRAHLYEPNAIEDTVVVRAVRFERFNDEPPVGMRCSDLGPPHAMTLSGCCDSGQFFAIAGEAAGISRFLVERWAAERVRAAHATLQRTTITENLMEAAGVEPVAEERLRRLAVQAGVAARRRASTGVWPVQRLNARKNALGSENPSRNEISAIDRPSSR